MFRAIYQKELLASSRKLRIPVIIIVYNLLLATLASLAYFVEFQSKIKFGSIVHNRCILDIYTMLAIVEFLFVIIVVPAYMASIISVEKERHTLEIVLATNVSATTFVCAKLLANFTILMVILISTLPVVSIVFLVGGVSAINVLDLFLLLFVTMIYLSAFCVLCSVLLSRSSYAIVAGYVVEMMLLFGSIGAMIGVYVYHNASMGSLVDNLIDSGTLKLGNLRLLLLLNPIYGFMKEVNGQVGTLNSVVSRVYEGHGAGEFLTVHWVEISSGIQLLVAGLLILLSCKLLYPSLDAEKNKRIRG